MVNENCIKGCPARISHISELTFCTFNCNRIKERNLLKTIFKMPAIYPWDLEYYSAIGINNFKVTSREYTRANCVSVRYLNNFLNAVDNGVDDYYFKEFCYDMFGFNDVGYNLRVSHLKPYLQDITYFIKNGDKCATRCGATCFRCEEIANQLEEFLRYV